MVIERGQIQAQGPPETVLASQREQLLGQLGSSRTVFNPARLKS